MVWAAFCEYGCTGIVFIEGTVSSAKYTYLLSNSLLPIAHYQYGDDYMFQQDNCSVHISKATQKLFENEYIEVLNWPSKTPVLDLIENLWEILSQKVYHTGNKQMTQLKS